jgi:hypothetical protein
VRLDPPDPNFDAADAFDVASGPVVLTPATGTPITTTGSVRFVWSPTPRLAFSVVSASMMPILEAVEVSVPGLNLRGRGWLANQTRTSSEMRVTGYVDEPAHEGPVPTVAESRFVLVNFVDMAEVTFSVGEWEVTLEPMDALSELLRAGIAARGHLGTHIGRLRRKDGALFRPESANELEDILYWGLAFARAQHVGVELTTGFHDNGLAVWRQWRGTIVDRASPHFAWFEPKDPPELVELLTAFATSWVELGPSIPTALSFYLEANTSGVPETSIVVGAAGLDLITWLTLVERGPGLSVDAFDRLWQSDRIRLLLDAASTPREIPAQLPNLAAHAANQTWVDGPHAITELRNAIVHPKRRMRAASAPVPVRVEAKRLLLWYFELAMLRLVGYRGRYVPHLASFPSGRIGAPRPVPWRDP